MEKTYRIHTGSYWTEITAGNVTDAIAKFCSYDNRGVQEIRMIQNLDEPPFMGNESHVNAYADMDDKILKLKTIAAGIKTLMELNNPQ